MNVTVGARIREERIRMNMSQPDFAAIAGAKQGAQLKWEKDQSAPSAHALAAWASAGVDVLYILTGIRQDAPGRREIAANVDLRLDKIEYALEWNNANRMSETDREVLRQSLFVELTSIATSESYDVLERYRHRADDILRNHFDDPLSAKRREDRFAFNNARSEKAEQHLQEVLSGLSMDIDARVEIEILALMINYSININELVPLLSAMKRSIKHGVAWHEKPNGDNSV